MPASSSRPATGGGFSLVEVVVATAIVSVGLAGLALLLLASVQGTAAARHRTTAVLEAESLGASIALAPDAAVAEDPATTTGDACEGPGDCEANVFLEVNQAGWSERLGATLPSPHVSLCTTADALACGDFSPGVRLDWAEPLEPGGREVLVLRWGSP